MKFRQSFTNGQAFLDGVILAIILGFCVGVANAQSTTCPGVLSISASLGGCDNVFVGWTHSGSLAVSSQSLVYGDGFRPAIDLSARSYSRTGVGCSYSTPVTVTQTYTNNQTCIAYYNDNHNRPCSQCAGVTAPMSVVSAANYRSSATADSIATAFADGISTVTAIANFKPLPTNLGGVQVWVDGVPAELFYVSPGQVNFHVPAGITAGLRSVRATNAAGQSFNGDIYIAMQAPGVFTKDGTGQGAAAADYAPTYLSIFATGLDLTIIGKADIWLQTSTARYPATYAGPTGDKLVGLQQINFVGVPINGQGAQLIVGGFTSQGFDLRK